MKNLTISEKEQALQNINFFVGGLTDEGIEYYYLKMVKEGKIGETNISEVVSDISQSIDIDAISLDFDIEKYQYYITVPYHFHEQTIEFIYGNPDVDYLEDGGKHGTKTGFDVIWISPVIIPSKKNSNKF